MAMLYQTGEVLGKSRTHLWLRLDHPERRAKLILTLPRKVLPRGEANARLVSIEWDGVVVCDTEDTAEISGYYSADVRITKVLEYNEDGDTAR